jgi:hypothetical protein
MLSYIKKIIFFCFIPTNLTIISTSYLNKIVQISSNSFCLKMKKKKTFEIIQTCKIKTEYNISVLWLIDQKSTHMESSIIKNKLEANLKNK